jgi:hypothetical protein
MSNRLWATCPKASLRTNNEGLLRSPFSMFDCLVMPYHWYAFFFEHCLDKLHSLGIFWHMPEDHTRANFPFFGK